MASKVPSVEERRNGQPQLQERSEAWRAMVEDGEDDVQKAAEAERRVIAELRRLGGCPKKSQFTSQ